MGENNSERYIVAFEIGSSKIRGAVGVVDHSGVVDIVATEEEKLTDKVRYGCIQNVEVSNALSCVVERLEAYQRVEPRQITGAYVALGGRSLNITQVDVSITLGSETEITRPLINDLMQKAAARIGSDRDVVDVVPVRFTVDNKTQNNPIGTYGQQLGARMSVVSCVPQIKRMLRRVIEERLGIDINGYITRPLAEAEMVLTGDERRLGCMFVDFGAETISVAIYKGGAPVYLATLPIGSRNITMDLCALNYTEERAEEIKKLIGNALGNVAAPEGGRRKNPADFIDNTEVNNYVHARADEIAANIMAQPEYAGLRDTDLPGGIVITGGGARLKGFNDLLSQQSKMKVRVGAPTGAVRISDGSVHGSEAVDVISIVVAAAKMPEAECVTPVEEVQENLAGGYEGMYGDDDPVDEGASRIGRLDDEFSEEPQGKKAKEKENKEEKGKKKGPGLLEMLKVRIAGMMNDNSNWEGEDE